MSEEERKNIDAEISSVLADLERVMAELRPAVEALQGILTTEPEVVAGDNTTA